MGSTWPSLVALALIVVALPATAWLLRRTGRPGGAAGATLGIVAAIAVGTRERIALLHAGGKWLVVGITAHSITTLAELDQAPEGIDALAHGGPSGRFADVLRSLSGHGSKPA